MRGGLPSFIFKGNNSPYLTPWGVTFSFKRQTSSKQIDSGKGDSGAQLEYPDAHWSHRWNFPTQNPNQPVTSIGVEHWAYTIARSCCIALPTPLSHALIAHRISCTLRCALPKDVRRMASLSTRHPSLKWCQMAQNVNFFVWNEKFYQLPCVWISIRSQSSKKLHWAFLERRKSL